MRILLISNFYPPRVFGGYELYAEGVVAGLRKRGHEVYILTSQGTGFTDPNVFPVFHIKIKNFYNASKVNIFKKVFRFFFSRKNFLITKDIISRVNPDIISLWNLRLISIAPLIAAAHSGKPLVLHLYDTWFLPIRVFKYFPPLMDSFIDVSHVITCSGSLARQYELAGIKKECILILPHGVSVQSVKASNRGNCNKRKLLIISSLSKEKGIDIALRALAILVNKRCKVQMSLDIYGDGNISYIKSLESIIKKEGIESYVHFKGRISPELLNDVFFDHDIFICPERWPALPLVLLQAMASQMPVIGIDSKGMDEVILDVVNGLLVPSDDIEALADAIDRLDTDEPLRGRIALRARETIVDRFNIELDIKKIESYYLTLIGK